jgi:transcriptional regulator with XRE-family HTH domain
MATRPFRRRRLGRELEKLRLAARPDAGQARRLGIDPAGVRGLTPAQTARLADVNLSTVSRVENGTLAVKINTVRGLLEAYGTTGANREAILELARSASEPAFWHSFTGVLPTWFHLYVDTEAEASGLATYDCQFINGLVQTEEYARALYQVARPDDEADAIDKMVALRLQRQQQVLNGKLKLRMILDEVALHRAYGGPSVLRGQLEHLLKIARLRRVSLQLLPASPEQPAVAGSFHMLDFDHPDDPTLVYVETEAGALYLEKSEEIRAYARAYDRLRAAACSPEDSAARIVQLMEETSDANRR